MIALAMLLGGDYTSGVKGVGIVNGMEVLQAFDVSVDIKSGLTKFRQWLDGFELADVATKTPAEKEFHNKHRSARNRWIAPKDFPSPSVLTAYQKPVVDKSDARGSSDDDSSDDSASTAVEPVAEQELNIFTRTPGPSLVSGRVIPGPRSYSSSEA